MFSFKQSLAALAGLLVIAAAVALLPHAGLGQSDVKNPLKRDPRRSFYLTQTNEYTGAQALAACAEGYHMASLWEIFDPSNLRYATELGLTTADSGFGPPSGGFGWIRTGNDVSAFQNPGFVNCQAYTSASDGFFGTVAQLPDAWDLTEVTVISPWQANRFTCSNTARVWCVQN